MDNQPLPRLNPEALKEERHSVDLGTESEADGHDHVARAPGRPPKKHDEELRQPISGVSPPAR